MIGSTISHYKIESKLGEGGMGVVYKATDTKLDRTVALKFLPRQAGATPEERQRFVNEARAASALDHPHICNIHDVDETDDGQMFIVMGFYEGETLDQRVAEGPLPVKDVVDFAIQSAEGLEAAHAKGIVHRDIKSSNLIVTPEGQLKIMDFGLAKSSAVSMVTQAGVAVGTVPFMSPEQARGETVDKRTDIWSLGAVMYHMLAGRLPFQGDYAEALVYLILNEEPPEISSLRKDVPDELVAIVAKCLRKDPQQRYQDMNELLADLYRLKGTPAGLHVSWSLLKSRWLSPLVLIPAAAGIIVVLVALFVPLASVDENAVIGSIAVLPLENLSGDPGQDYLAAGLHEALITDLTKLTGFKRVIARASVRRFQNTTLPPSEISRELGVDAIMTGSVVRSGDRVQVTAHLIRATSEDPMWSERFEREFKDVLSLQHDIVGTLAREIRLQLTPEEQTDLEAVRTVNPDAYEAYLKGKFENDKQTPDSYDRAEEYFLKALEIDPDYALAYAGLAFTWMMRGDTGYEPPSETFPKGRELIDKALELDPTSAEARYIWATVKAGIDWDWAAAEKAFREAISLNPNMADAHFFLADLLVVLGREDEWEGEIRVALELDPLNDFNRSFYGWHLNYVGRYDEAIPIFLELREAGPNKASNHLGLWGAYYMKKQYAEAASSARDYFNEIADSEFADAVDSPSGWDEYREAMRRTGELMARRSRERHVPATRIARMFAHAGENEKALDWLEKAYEAHESTLMRLKVFWDWQGLRQEERYRELLRKVGLESR